jgi:uncharacterized protein
LAERCHAEHMQLTPNAVRILGSLVEKELTVPDTYPLTINSLVTAANQSTNRFPVMSLTAVDVQQAINELKSEYRLVRMLPSGAGNNCRASRSHQSHARLC